MQAALAVVGRAGHSSSSSSMSGTWRQARAAHCPKPDKSSVQDMFFHVGYINFQTWLFTVMHLEHQLLDCDVALKVVCNEDGPCLSRVLPLLKARVDFQYEWKASFWVIRSNADRVQSADMIPGHMLAYPCEHTPELVVWKGSVMEALGRQQRAAAAAAAAAARQQQRPRGGRGGARGAQPRHQQERKRRQPAVRVPDALADAFDDQDSEVEALLQESSDDEIGVEVDADLQAADQQLEEAPADEEDAPARRPRHVPAPAEEGEGGTLDESRVAAAIVRVRTGTELKLVLPDQQGEIHFYPKQRLLTAFCPCARHGDCRRSRTVNESSKPDRHGQGRPLGMLMAWLSAAGACATKEEHKRLSPDYEARLAARRLLQGLPGSEQMFEKERPTRRNEGDEPRTIP